MENKVAYENDHLNNLKATELRLGLPGTTEEKGEERSVKNNSKRQLPETSEESVSISNKASSHDQQHLDAAPPAK